MPLYRDWNRILRDTCLISAHSNNIFYPVAGDNLIDYKECIPFYVIVTQSSINKVYREHSNIWRTKSQNFNVSRFGLQLSLRNILKPGVKWRMKL